MLLWLNCKWYCTANLLLVYFIEPCRIFFISSIFFLVLAYIIAVTLYRHEFYPGLSERVSQPRWDIIGKLHYNASFPMTPFYAGSELMYNSTFVFKSDLLFFRLICSYTRTELLSYKYVNFVLMPVFTNLLWGRLR